MVDRFVVKNYPKWKQYQKRVPKTLLGKCLGYKIYLVDGVFVRTFINVDFLAGYSPVDPYIPKKEIWIDKAIPKGEITYYVPHELFEAILVNDCGYNYDVAHSKISEIEKLQRRIDEGE